MILDGAPINQVIDLLIDEQSVLMNRTDSLFFEVQVKPFPEIWGDRSVEIDILDKKKGEEKIKFLKENPPIILDVSQDVIETHTLVVVEQTGGYKIYISAINHPELYKHQEESSLVDVSKQPNFSFISNTQLRAIYQTKYKQGRVTSDLRQQIVSQPPSTDEEKRLLAKGKQRAARYQQMRLQCLPMPHNRYDAKGRHLHAGSIAIGLVF